VNRGVIALVVAAAVVLATGAVATAAKSPRTVYTALLTTAIPSGSLPGAFKYDDAKIGTSEASKRAKSHHVIGEVEIDIGSDAVVEYLVFPSRADAVAEWKDANLKGQAKTTLPAPPKFPWPAVIANSAITGKNVFGKKVKNGVTIFAFTSKNVIVEALTISTDNETSGDIPGAISLGTYALTHLNALRR
jgi:hypothetical protein